MKNVNTMTYLLKGILLLILDIVTFIFVFSVWSLLNIPLFPWAFTAVLLSLVLINFAVVFFEKGIRLFGVGVSASGLAGTIIYYLFVMWFTKASYIWISSRNYSIVILIGTLVYIGVILGLYFAGVNNNKEMARRKTEQAQVLDVTLQTMSIHENIEACRDFVAEADYDAMLQAFNGMNERLTASTPFGRVAKQAVTSTENQIVAQLSAVNDAVASLKASAEPEKKHGYITESLNNVRSLIVNREKVITK